MRIIKDRKFETEALRRFLAQMKVGDVVTFHELSSIAGTSIRSTSAPFTSARRIVLHEDGIVLDNLRGVGYRRASDEALATSVSDKDLRKSRRHSVRALKKMSCVEDFGAMPLQAQIAHTIKASFFAATRFMAHRSTLARVVTPVVTGRATELPVRETLAAFSKK